MFRIIKFDKIKKIAKILLGEFTLFFLRDWIFKLKLYSFFRKVSPVSTNHELIRIGSDYDGGYLVPNDLNGILYCFSPGVSNISDFELSLANNYQIKCFLADYSVNKPPTTHPLFEFEKKFLSSSVSPIHITLDDWVMRNAEDSKELILQMDIEGDEYDVFFATSEETLKRFRIMVIEFHSMRRLFYPYQDEPRFIKIDKCFKKLLRYFEIVHIHLNNCSQVMHFNEFSTPDLLEVTFHRKDRISHKSKRRDFPHQLDRKNVASMPDLYLPRCWYSKPK